MSTQLIDKATRRTMFYVAPERLTVIGVDTDDASFEDHRLWDPRVEHLHTQLPEATIASIAEHGVVEPILVEVDKEDRLLVYSGRGRTLMARRVNELRRMKGTPPIEVPVLARRYTPQSAPSVDLKAIICNEHQRPDSMLDRAHKAQHLKTLGHEPEAIATAFGVSTRAIGYWLTLLRMSGKVQRAVEEGRLSPTAAVGMASLSHEEQDQKLPELLAETDGTLTRPSARQTKAAAKAAKTGEDTYKPTIRELRRVVEDDSGTLSEQFVLGVRFAIGDYHPSKVAGLLSIIRGDK